MEPRAMTYMNADRLLVVNDSSLIDQILYWVEGEEMEVDFSNASRYLYHNVKPGVFGKLAESESVGKSFLAIRSSLTEYDKVN